MATVGVNAAQNAAILAAEMIALADEEVAQKPDGAYLTGKTDYTSVIYPAKSLLEFADAERIADRNEQADSLEQSVCSNTGVLISL